MDNDNIKKYKSIGIDLGTTTTLMAVVEENLNGTVEPKIVHIDGDILLPSIIYWDGRTYVGKEAKQKKEHDISVNLEQVRYIENTKRQIGKENLVTTINAKEKEKSFTPIDVATIILKYLLQNNDKNSELNSLDDLTVYLTVPAQFDTDKRKATLAAAIGAKLKEENVRLYEEPMAALLSYLHDQRIKPNRNSEFKLNEQGTRFVVVDIGGGTCDICIEDVKITDGKLKIEKIGKADGDYIGGVNFDENIAKALENNYDWIDVSNGCDKKKLEHEAREIKIQMSKDLGKCRPVLDYKDPNWIDTYKRAFEDDVDEDLGIRVEFPEDFMNKTIELSIDEICNAIRGLIYSHNKTVINHNEAEENKNIEDLINRTLKNNHIERDTIDYIFLTGGMAKYFAVKAMLYDIFKKPILVPNEPEHAVALGAALLAQYPDVIEADNKTNFSYLLELNNGDFFELIKPDAIVSCDEKWVNDTFKVGDYNERNTFSLYIGKGEFDSDLRRSNVTYFVQYENGRKPDDIFKLSYTIDKNKIVALKRVNIDSKYINCQENKLFADSSSENRLFSTKFNEEDAKEFKKVFTYFNSYYSTNTADVSIRRLINNIKICVRDMVEKVNPTELILFFSRVCNKYLLSNENIICELAHYLAQNDIFDLDCIKTIIETWRWDPQLLTLIESIGISRNRGAIELVFENINKLFSIFSVQRKSMLIKYLTRMLCNSNLRYGETLFFYDLLVKIAQNGGDDCADSFNSALNNIIFKEDEDGRKQFIEYIYNYNIKIPVVLGKKFNNVRKDLQNKSESEVVTDFDNIDRWSNEKFLKIMTRVVKPKELSSKVFNKCFENMINRFEDFSESDKNNVVATLANKANGNQQLRRGPELEKLRNFCEEHLDECSIGSNIALYIMDGDKSFLNNVFEVALVYGKNINEFLNTFRYRQELPNEAINYIANNLDHIGIKRITAFVKQLVDISVKTTRFKSLTLALSNIIDNIYLNIDWDFIDVFGRYARLDKSAIGSVYDLLDDIKDCYERNGKGNQLLITKINQVQGSITKDKASNPGI